MTTNYSPGPYHTEEWAYSPGYDTAIVDENGDMLAVVDTTEHRSGNAKLFKAAPALLEALEKTLESLLNWMEIADKEDEREYDYKARDEARSAILLVKGKTP